MPRNYILKLEEVEFTYTDQSDALSADITEHFPDGIPDFTGTTLEIGGEKFLTAGSFDTDHIFTRDGVMPEDEPEEYTGIDFTSLGPIFSHLKANKYPFAGAPYTLSVYLYTGEDDEDPSSRNFSFSDHSRNDVDGIDNLMDALLGNEEA